MKMHMEDYYYSPPVMRCVKEACDVAAQFEAAAEGPGCEWLTNVALPIRMWASIIRSSHNFYCVQKIRDDYAETLAGEPVVPEKKGTVKHPVPRIDIGETGIAGDAHAGMANRQVSLLDGGSIDRFSKEIGRDITYGEFAENITTRGFDTTKVWFLDRIRIGPVELEVTQLGKKCHGDTCAIFREVGRCVMPKEGIFCRVIKGGEIKAGDEMMYQPYNLDVGIITLSDRAYAGEYEDRSGPKIQECVEEFFKDKPWRIRPTITVIPDDVKRLRDEFEKMCSACDVVFTTGGTGIGPRDVTPDVIGPLPLVVVAVVGPRWNRRPAIDDLPPHSAIVTAQEPLAFFRALACIEKPDELLDHAPLRGRMVAIG